jgi:hypothetical protein
LNKFAIFATLGSPEVWRHDGARVAIFTWVHNNYIERAESVVLPKVSSAILTELIDASRQLKPRLAPPGAGVGTIVLVVRIRPDDRAPPVWLFPPKRSFHASQACEKTTG